MTTLLYRIYQIFVAMPLFLIATLLTALSTAFGSIIGDHKFWGYRPGLLWGRFTCWIFLLPVEVERHASLEEGRSYIFVANHQGAMDIFLVYGYLGYNFKWMLKQALRKMPFVGYACEKGRHIFVDRTSVHKIKRTIDNARQILKGGMNLMVFPEGARTVTGRMGQFKRGAYQLAEELQLPIVPITIDGAYNVFPRGKGYWFVRRHKLRLVVHAPIAPPSKEAGNMREVMDESRRIINSALPASSQDQ